MNEYSIILVYWKISNNSGVLIYVCNLNTWEWMLENSNFESSMCYIMSSKSIKNYFIHEEIEAPSLRDFPLVM